ncbi:sulfotransferase domain-containing protein [Rhodovulum adriaticum]|uniref:Sulfotransferase domain-containing protein n=2 Tax=Rhodovulum adriaticum TaxID=35804 RepID=A0A4R2NIR1_RHOAD|nr:sulfotransferase domain-containing protein [Rhodovulum adriaticum]TCP21383.1 sulfotransferase domain-containing protein [Rhodovulum adriaticum]
MNKANDRFLDETLPPKVLLATQRKAGTYLLAAILAELGFQQTYYHINRRKMQAYDPYLMELGLSEPRKFDVRVPLRHSLKLIRHREFAASHLRPSRTIRRMTQNFHIVGCVRDLRTSLMSYARFVATSGRKSDGLAEDIRTRGPVAFIEKLGRREIRQARAYLAWQDQPNAIVLKFEDLMGDPASAIGQLADFLGVQVTDPAAVMARAKARPTLTKSEGYIELDWGEAEEALFQRLGGPAANRALGYAD